MGTNNFKCFETWYLTKCVCFQNFSKKQNYIKQKGQDLLLLKQMVKFQQDLVPAQLSHRD
jgi:hypothetical protein